MQNKNQIKIKKITINICEPYLKGKGKECHTPGCALFLHKVDLPIHPEIYEVLKEFILEETPDFPYMRIVEKNENV